MRLICERGAYQLSGSDAIADPEQITPHPIVNGIIISCERGVFHTRIADQISAVSRNSIMAARGRYAVNIADSIAGQCLVLNATRGRYNTRVIDATAIRKLKLTGKKSGK